MGSPQQASQKHPQIAIIGGGAAGFFCALTVAEANPDARVTIYEKGKHFLQKVKVSGGGRCNVTHSCFDPASLATFYPRGSRELRGAFHRWQPQGTIDWFSQRGVELKTEEDGRMFPVTDDSQTIIDCFMQSAREGGVVLRTGLALEKLAPAPDGSFTLGFSDGSTARADKACIACGSLKASPLSRMIQSLGHTIEPLAPSLFAFNVSDRRIIGLAGLSVQDASVRVLASSAPQSGPLLITHRGFSGPAILRLSAWEARALQEAFYEFEISINWLGNVSESQLQESFNRYRKSSGKATVKNKHPGAIPRRLWDRFMETAGVAPDTRWAQLPKDQETALARALLDSRFEVRGKTTNKEEFVTCGGVHLKEIDFRRMESRLVPGLHFAGECLDIDGLTGGFNFQAAWTAGHIAGLAMAEVEGLSK
ncbi:NAD(P)/FAD-dependent oxidoreductase [Puniceicoccales bacterium CK1056]|uniref:NAD(P)/FAD-dependent oxidoreductase n=1 Tax=Oceanipulchritudo coccoides TaxID=2706888 RepID=A0A6B2M5Q2_9BACT|nr:NAD(P)/FAD-dependent oxidoreductase [Oceanipulchritudo coccoides]NDV63562.1 NAD(P)/FAD-dependent oxidoreductase [Oceanipulchritudo coccoides]